MTLKEMSEKTGFSVSFLSQVENGSSSLAITSLQKISEALNVPISSFFEEPMNNTFTTRGAERRFFRIEHSNLLYARLAGNFQGQVLEPLYVTLEPKKTVGRYNHHGEEFYYVLQGEVVVTVNNKKYVLQEGDSIHLPSILKHSMRNPTDKPVHMIAVLTPAIFQG